MADKPKKPTVGLPVVYMSVDDGPIPGLIKGVHDAEEGKQDLGLVTLVVFSDCNGTDTIVSQHSEDQHFWGTWHWPEVD